MSQPNFPELTTCWDKIRAQLGATEVTPEELLSQCRTLLNDCVAAGSWISDSGDRAGLRLLAREIADEIHRLTGEFPQAAIKPSASPDRSKRSIARPPRLERLPITAAAFETFVGREDRIAFLDQVWEEKKVNVVVLIAPGGVGKTTLIKYWLNHMASKGYGAARVFGWSFYAPRSQTQEVSSTEFLEDCRQWLEVSFPEHATPWHIGKILADALAEERSLLVLDGLEPMQYQTELDEGMLKEPTLATLLKSLASKPPGSCLCVVTTRLHIADLDGFGETVVQQSLEYLSEKAGAELLYRRGVNRCGNAEIDPDDPALLALARELKGHALSLTLIGQYLKSTQRGDVRAAKILPDWKTGKDYPTRHFERVMESYGKALEERELGILRLLSLFGQPAEWAALKAVRRGPVIPGLTEAVRRDEEWNLGVEKLRKQGLLDKENPAAKDVFDCHPLIRDFFRDKLKTEQAEGWKEAQERLFKYCLETGPGEDELPDGKGLLPLYRAVAHGCQAGLYPQAFEVLWKRIQRGEEAYSARKFGALSDDLNALSHFFVRTWDEPVPGLDDEALRIIFTMAGVRLHALGRLSAAAVPMLEAVERCKTANDTRREAVNHLNLSLIYLAQGDFRRAERHAKSADEVAGREEKLQPWRKAALIAQANILNNWGRGEKADELLGRAEQLGDERPKEHPLVYASHQYHHLYVMIDKGCIGEATKQAEQMLKWGLAEKASLDEALGHLALGQALMPAEGGDADQLVEEHLRQANDLLLAGRYEEFQVHAILARAKLFRKTGRLVEAQTELAQAIEMAKRREMALFTIDCCLEEVRLYLAEMDTAKKQGDEAATSIKRSKAEGLLKSVEKQIQERDYRLKEGVLAELQKKLAP